MDRSNISERLRLILATALKHENFEMKDELLVSDVEGWDSLSHMIIISEIESSFNIKFKLRELNKMSNIGTILDVVQSKL